MRITEKEVQVATPVSEVMIVEKENDPSALVSEVVAIGEEIESPASIPMIVAKREMEPSIPLLEVMDNDEEVNF